MPGVLVLSWRDSSKSCGLEFQDKNLSGVSMPKNCVDVAAISETVREIDAERKLCCRHVVDKKDFVVGEIAGSNLGELLQGNDSFPERLLVFSVRVVKGMRPHEKEFPDYLGFRLSN